MKRMVDKQLQSMNFSCAFMPAILSEVDGPIDRSRSVPLYGHCPSARLPDSFD